MQLKTGVENIRVAVILVVNYSLCAVSFMKLLEPCTLRVY